MSKRTNKPLSEQTSKRMDKSMDKSINEQMNVFPSSEVLINKKHKGLKHDWPWTKLECGQSFKVMFDEIKEATLRARCSQKGGELGKKFRMVKHDDCYEVGRVA